MAGFAVLVQPDSTAQARQYTFDTFLSLTAELKHLDRPSGHAVGSHCTAAKFDSPPSQHRGIIRDEKTGSWILATGTIVCLADNSTAHPDLNSVLQGYLRRGIRSLDEYDGHFALVIYNGLSESLSVISDPIGLFSIYYGSHGKQTFVSTSVLAVAKQIGSKPDVLAIEHFLRIGEMDGRRTMWQDVKRLPPASILKITNDSVETCEYWAPWVDEQVARLSFNEALLQVETVLAHTFERSLRSEGQVWADLTGGFDTRLTTLMMSKVGIPFVANCVGPANHPDVKISALISRELGWAYRHLLPPDHWDRDDNRWFEIALGKGDAHLSVPTLASVLRGHVTKAETSKVHVLGLGGEDWRGYFYSGALLNIGRSTRVDYETLLNKLYVYPVPLAVFRKNRTREVRQAQQELYEELGSRYADLPNTVKLDRFNIHDHICHGGAYFAASLGILRSIIPLYFKDPLNFAFSLNYRWKLPLHHRFIRTFLERQNPGLANIETTTGGPAIPIRLTNLHRFGPLWQRLLNRTTNKFSQKLLGRPVRLGAQKSLPCPNSEPEWKQAWLKYVASEDLLKPSAMHTGLLYNANELKTLFAQYDANRCKYYQFLERVVTVEMAMRVVGTTVEDDRE